ncbi:MAG TPA: energy-coupling factor transporter transmembrane component T [Nocardioidaceae bacterium]|nr:energy-coupling factor transporter transmembrane component T [Nocardioidaceae bacterium]
MSESVIAVPERSGYGPLAAVLASLLPVAGAVAIHTLWHGLVCVGVLVVLAPIVVRDWPGTLRRVALGLVAAAMLLVSTYLYGGRHLDVAGAAALRVLYLVLPAAALTAAIDPTRLGDHLGQRLRLPARPVVAATAALSRIGSVGAQWQQISRARRARGMGLEGGPVNRVRVAAAMSLALLVATMRMTGTMALAMDARGFAGAVRRTWAEPAPWRLGDTVLVLAGVGLALLPWVLRLG